jgi:hypothetical protein
MGQEKNDNRERWGIVSRNEHFKRLWASQGTLYTEQDDEQMARDVLDELERQHGPMRSTLPLRTYQAGMAWAPCLGYGYDPKPERPKPERPKPRKAKPAPPAPAEPLDTTPVYLPDYVPMSEPARPPPYLRYLEEATDEEIRAVVLHGGRNMTTSSAELEQQARELLTEMFCRLKLHLCNGLAIKEHGLEVVQGYLDKSSCNNRPMKLLVMEHVQTVLEYGWAVYSKWVEQGS